MSSHHFVRDKQEPALIIANGEACNAEILGQLLEWNPTVVVLDGALDRVANLGIGVDYWLGDFDSAQPQTKEWALERNVVTIYTPNQDKTDLEKGIDFLIAEGHSAANIVWATGKRADHTFHNLGVLSRYRDLISLVILDNHSRIYPLPRAFKKHYLKGTKISLLPTGEAKQITSKNLLFPLLESNLALPYGTGSSNEVAETGFVEITYTDGNLLLMECWD